MPLMQVNDQIVNARHETARRYAENGIPVFPCKVNGKAPATPHGLLDRTTDMAAIDKWWAEGDFNIGVVPEDAGWCVVDLDVKHDGPATWAALGGEKPETYTVATAGGGRHKYFEGSLPSSAGKLAPGVDTRGRGSYVIVPPSVVNGKEYILVDDRDLAPLPAWVTAAIDRHRDKPAAPAPEDVELDTKATIRWAIATIDYDLGVNGEPVEGGASDNRTYEFVNTLLDGPHAGQSLSDLVIIDLLLEHWAPHFDRHWIEDKVESACKHRQNGVGCGPAGSAERVFGPASRYAEYLVDLPVEEPAAPATWPVIHRASALLDMQFAKPEWVWDRRILAYKPNLLTGDSGTGKTTLAENIAVAVAGGLPLLGADTRKMPVLLLVGEDEYGPVRDNLAAIRAATGAPVGALEDIHVLSTESEAVAGGHVLARIADDGEVKDTAFMREFLAPWLASFDGPVLWIMDPLEEFVQFNRLNDDASRALATTWLRAVTRIGAGRITPMVNDHPSAAGMASGRHYAGSVQMRAAFPFFSTLIAGEWSGTIKKQRKLTLKGMKARYGAEDTVEFYRTSDSPAFTVQGIPGHSLEDYARKVYDHIMYRLKHGKEEKDRKTGRDARSPYGPWNVAEDLGMDQRDVDRAMKGCVANKWLIWEEGSGSGGTNRVAAGFAPGSQVPPFKNKADEEVSY